MIDRRLLQSFALALLVLVAACGGAEEPAPEAPAETAEPAENTPEAPATEPEAEPEAEAPAGNPLLDPLHPDANQRAPESFRVAFDTTKGRFIVEVNRAWAPMGADRFYNLVQTGYYNGNKFFRVVDGFVAQFGMNGDPAINEAWDMASIPDDPMGEMNTRGRLTFAHGGPNTRTTQLFINLQDNLNLDNMGFPPFGEVIEGMGVIESFYSDYGDGPPYGSGPDQTMIGSEGTAYLEREYPMLDYIESATVIAER